jgi:hypothetical protein
LKETLKTWENSGASSSDAKYPPALNFFGTFFLKLTCIITSIGAQTTSDENTEGHPKISNPIFNILVVDLKQSKIVQAIGSDLEDATSHAGLIIIPALVAKFVTKSWFAECSGSSDQGRAKTAT